MEFIFVTKVGQSVEHIHAEGVIGILFIFGEVGVRCVEYNCKFILIRVGSILHGVDLSD